MIVSRYASRSTGAFMRLVVYVVYLTIKGLAGRAGLTLFYLQVSRYGSVVYTIYRVYLEDGWYRFVLMQYAYV